MRQHFSLINDWKYLFSDWAIGGRFALFTFISFSWLKPSIIEDYDVGGLSIVILGLGVRIH